MPRLQTAQELLEEAIAAPEAADKAKRKILEKAEMYGGAYLFAFVACVVLIFYAGWFRWVAGFFVALCLIAAWGMRGALAELRRSYVALGRGDSVLTNHRMLNAIALVLVTYALLAVWASWPVPSLAVLAAAIINFIHYAGYRRSRRRG